MKKSLVLISVIFLSLSICNSNILVENLPAENDVKSSGNNQSSPPSTISLPTNGSYIEEAMTIISSTPTDVIRNIQVSNQNGTVKVIHFLTDTNIWNLDTWNGNEWSRQSFLGNNPHNSHFSTDGFKGEFFIYNHTFYKTIYQIGDSCDNGNSMANYEINMTILNVDEGVYVTSMEDCLPSHFGVIEFDLIGDRIGYVVSGQGDVAYRGTYWRYYRADSGIIFNLLNNSHQVTNFGNRFGNAYGLMSDGNGYGPNSEDFAVLDNMSCLVIGKTGSTVKCHDDAGNQILQHTEGGVPHSIMKDNHSLYLHPQQDPHRIIKIDSNLNVDREYNTNIVQSADIYSSIVLGYVSTDDGKIYSAIQNTTIEIGTEFLLSIGNGTKQISENFIEIRKDNLGNTDLYTLWHDYDNDTISNDFDEFPFDISQNIDTDNDGFGDNPNGFEGDTCPFQPGTSTLDVFGCLDTDNDGYSNNGDRFPFENSQWNDTDGDGYGDNSNGFQADACYLLGGSSSLDRYGCIDTDKDGYSDPDNTWFKHPLGLADAFPSDSTQSRDTDGDGYGDMVLGFEGDNCPTIHGASVIDRFGCLDSDEDGYSNIGDDLPNNPTQWIDRDGDGFGDNQSGTEPDVFPTDGTQWIDFDGDGYGDNILGNQGDAFPDDPLEWKDSDGDYLGDNADIFPFDPTQTEDRDGDGMGDNPMGIGADKFPDDPTQWSDIDGDGYGDNPLGNNPDVFITDATQWFDRDGDGRGDNDQGRNYDRFPDNPTQWIDLDEDGLGDNQSGTNADPFLNDFDNDGYNDSIDILPKLASPGDLDADGCLDEVDAFPSDSQECIDTDGDGVGNNADSDDDGDGWTDADEERLGTDSLSASEQPVDSFEIVIPGTAVGLGAWDLIGIFGGVPFFAWVGFGFATRNGRCARYEELLKEATSRDELEQVALRWEYSLMLRMLGPHQGIRLERLRAELDDKFENATYDEAEIGFDQTNLVENEGKDIPPINESFSGPTKETAATSTDESGYEWFKHGEENWYRPVGSNDEWFRFEN